MKNAVIYTKASFDKMMSKEQLDSALILTPDDELIPMSVLVKRGMACSYKPEAGCAGKEGYVIDRAGFKEIFLRK